MKTPFSTSKKTLIWFAVTAGALVAGSVTAVPTPQIQTRQLALRKEAPDTGDTFSPGGGSGGSGSGREQIKIESIERNRGKEALREVSWLGVSTDEASEALSSQLGLKAGQGLVVIYVAPDSPAAKAGIQKHDVLAELGDQLLVNPAQLRKLVQMQKAGDMAKLTLHRAGKKQTVSATLAKRTEEMGLFLERQSLDGDLHELQFVPGAARIGDRIHEQLKVLHGSLTGDSADEPKVNVEVRRNMDEVRKAIQEALRHADHPGRETLPAQPALPQKPLIPAHVEVGDGATVTVKQDGVSVKTIVKSDDAGVYVIVATPKKHLMAQDKDGKLLFHGEIESQEEQQKVPAELWEKIKPMLQEIKPAEGGAPQPQAQSEGIPKT